MSRNHWMEGGEDFLYPTYIAICRLHREHGDSLLIPHVPKKGKHSEADGNKLHNNTVHVWKNWEMLNSYKAEGSRFKRVNSCSLYYSAICCAEDVSMATEGSGFSHTA